MKLYFTTIIVANLTFFVAECIFYDKKRGPALMQDLCIFEYWVKKDHFRSYSSFTVIVAVLFLALVSKAPS